MPCQEEYISSYPINFYSTLLLGHETALASRPFHGGLIPQNEGLSCPIQSPEVDANEI